MEHSKAKNKHPIHNWKVLALTDIIDLTLDDVDKIALIGDDYYRLKSISPPAWKPIGSDHTVLLNADNLVDSGKIKYSLIPTLAFNPVVNYGATNLDNSFQTRLMNVAEIAKMVKQIAPSQSEIDALKSILSADDVNLDELQEHIDKLKALAAQDITIGNRIQGLEDSSVNKTNLFSGGIIRSQLLAEDVFLLSNQPYTINARTGQFIVNSVITGAIVQADTVNMVDNRQHTIVCHGGTVTVVLNGATQNTDDITITDKSATLNAGEQMNLIKAELAPGSNINVLMWNVEVETPETQALITTVQTVQEQQAVVAPIASPIIMTPETLVKVPDERWFSTLFKNGEPNTHMIELTPEQYDNLPAITFDAIDNQNSLIEEVGFSAVQLDAANFQPNGFYGGDMIASWGADTVGYGYGVIKRPPNSIQLIYVDMTNSSFGAIRNIKFDGVHVYHKEVTLKEFSTNQIGATHRPINPIDISDVVPAYVTIETGHDLREGGALEIGFKDISTEGERAWPLAKLNMIDFLFKKECYVWNHNTSYINIIVDNVATGKIRIKTTNRPAAYTHSKLLKY